MIIKLELIKEQLCETITENLACLEINADEIADTTAIKALSEIQQILSDTNKSDFDAIENIISVFEKHGLDYGNSHDF